MDKLLLRSSEFENYVLNVLSYPLYDNSQRVKVSRIMCSVSLEHAESFKILLASRNFTSAIGLLRLQFECLVRGMWILYVATDCAVSKGSKFITFNIVQSVRLYHKMHASV